MLKQLRVSGGLWDVLLTALLMAVLGYAVFFLSAPIAQTDRAGREHRNIYLLALGILGFAQALTLEHFLLFAGYAVVFFAVRDVARSSRDTLWLPVLPVLAIAVWQAGWGVSQFFGGGDEAFAHGTYAIRNHFAAFMEMAL